MPSKVLFLQYFFKHYSDVLSNSWDFLLLLYFVSLHDRQTVDDFINDDNNFWYWRRYWAAPNARDQSVTAKSNQRDDTAR